MVSIFLQLVEALFFLCMYILIQRQMHKFSFASAATYPIRKQRLELEGYDKYGPSVC